MTDEEIYAYNNPTPQELFNIAMTWTDGPKRAGAMVNASLRGRVDKLIIDSKQKRVTS